MRSKISWFALIIIVAFMSTGCNNNNTTQPTQQDNANYFPNTNLTYYKYNISLTNSLGTVNTGTKSTTFAGTSFVGGITYQNQIDSLNTGGIISTNSSFFRKTGAGVYYFLDTTGISTLVPSQYLLYLTFSTELRVLASPLSDGLNWQAFKLGVAILNYNFIDVEAAYLGKENVPLNLTSGQVNLSAAKFQYVMTLQFPNPNNPLGPSTKSSFTAYGWFVENIGPVKWQGNAAILNGFSGGGINLGDTTTTVTQSLTGYSIK